MPWCWNKASSSPLYYFFLSKRIVEKSQTFSSKINEPISSNWKYGNVVQKIITPMVNTFFLFTTWPQLREKKEIGGMQEKAVLKGKQGLSPINVQSNTWYNCMKNNWKSLLTSKLPFHPRNYLWRSRMIRWILWICPCDSWCIST